jgi:hypothetical protein
VSVQEYALRRKSLAAGLAAIAVAATLQLPSMMSASAEIPAGLPIGNSGHGQSGPVLDDTHNDPTNAVAGDVTFEDNVKGVSGYSALNFIDYKNYGDFMFANGTGGLAIWSLKDRKHPALVGKVTAAELRRPGDTQDRFWEGENLTVDAKRKLIFMTRDPRGFGGTLTTGQSGFYIIDVKNPWKPRIVTFQSVPAGHTATCINDCDYLWSVGPYNTGTAGNDPSWHGVPIWVTDVRDINHPHTFQQAIDLNRFDQLTDYVHSVDVDKNGVAWTSGAGGVRGYWTRGRHYDPVKKVKRTATATDPVPYAGGTVVDPEPVSYFDHNAYHNTQKLGKYDKGELLYITEEDIRTCSEAGDLMIASTKGSYDGESWKSTPENPFRLNLVSSWTAWGQEGSSTTTASCSAHWFTVNGNIIAQGWYAQGTRFIDVSDPKHPKQVGYFRIPSGDANVTAGSASAAYWHNGYVYVADYSRGVDVLHYDGKLAGKPDKKICWNSCDK